MEEKVEYRVVTVITRGGSAGRPAEVLVEPRGDAWRLPVFTVANVPDSRSLAPALRAAVAERFGLAVAVLSLLQGRRGDAAEPRYAMVALDAYAVPKDGTGPAGAAWLTVDRLGSVTFEDDAETARALVGQWLADQRPGAGHRLRLPWTRPGWLAEATAWIESQIDQHGLAQAGPVEQHRTWSLSVLLRVPLAEGSAFFKALPPFFGAEPRITQALAQRFPGQFPEVIAIDAARHWLLMREFTGQPLRSCTDLAVWTDALCQYARLQAATIADPRALFALGCPDRRLAVLPDQFAAVLADRDLLLPNAPNGLTDAQIADLHALVPALPAACAALEACGVPYALEHGDLHGDNITLTPSGFVYFDWSDACLAHPFVCLTTMLENAPADWHAPLSEAYAAEWGAYASPEQVQRALHLAQPLGAAHHSVSYHTLLAATEPGQRWQLGGALPFFLRDVLRYKDILRQ